MEWDERNDTPGMGLTMMKNVGKHKGFMTLQTNNGYDIFIVSQNKGGQPWLKNDSPVDDDFLVLALGRFYVQDHIEVVGTRQGTAKDAVELYIAHQPDLVLMDIPRMEPTTGIKQQKRVTFLTRRFCS